MRPIPGAHPAGGLRPSKSAPGRFVWLRDKSSGKTICTAIAARRVVPRDGRNEHVPVSAKKTSEGASSVVCDGDKVRIEHVTI